MEYRDLLKRYMAFVREEEGITFLERLTADRAEPGMVRCDMGGSIRFTDAEHAMLLDLEREIEGDTEG